MLIINLDEEWQSPAPLSPEAQEAQHLQALIYKQSSSLGKGQNDLITIDEGSSEPSSEAQSQDLRSRIKMNGLVSFNLKQQTINQSTPEYPSSDDQQSHKFDDTEKVGSRNLTMAMMIPSNFSNNHRVAFPEEQQIVNKNSFYFRSESSDDTPTYLSSA